VLFQVARRPVHHAGSGGSAPKASAGTISVPRSIEKDLHDVSRQRDACPAECEQDKGLLPERCL